MFFLLQHGEEAAHTARSRARAEQTAEHAEHVPILAQMVNHYFGEWAYKFEINYTKPIVDEVAAKFGTTPEAVFGAYTPENAIPWYTIMFILACIITVALIWIMKASFPRMNPVAQQTLEVGVLAVRSMLEDIVGPHGLQYFPVVMTFAV
jgi:F0F1-type ATP synthase membrane subunit a